MNRISTITYPLLAVLCVASLSHAVNDQPAAAQLPAKQTTPPPTPITTPPALTDISVALSEDAVTFDGHVSSFEYADAAQFKFTAGHGQVTTYIKQYEGWLYFAFQIPEPTVHPGDDIVVMLNLDDPALVKPSAKCIRAYVRRKMENSRMHKGNDEKWVNLYGPFEYKAVTYNQGWEAEIRIPLVDIGVTEGQIVSIPLALRIWDNEPLAKWNWPLAADENKPDTWGKLTITATEQ